MIDTIKVNHIVATDLDGCIGKDNQLMWHIPADLRRFKSLTEGGVVVMGRKTFESLGCKPLPNRVNIVITNDFQFKINHINSKVIYYSLISAAIEKAKYEASVLGLKEVWVIGGQSIYEQTIQYVDKIVKTVVYNRFNGDTFYQIPVDKFEESSRSPVYADKESEISYQFITYRLIKEKSVIDYKNHRNYEAVEDVSLSGTTAGRKDDSNKPRYSLLPTGTVNQVVQVLEYGASDKYAVNNWQKIPDARTRFYDAAMRHIDDWWNGERIDVDKGDQKGSQLPHLAHAICCLLFLMWFDDQE